MWIKIRESFSKKAKGFQDVVPHQTFYRIDKSDDVPSFRLSCRPVEQELQVSIDVISKELEEQTAGGVDCEKQDREF